MVKVQLGMLHHSFHIGKTNVKLCHATEDSWHVFVEVDRARAWPIELFIDPVFLKAVQVLFDKFEYQTQCRQ